MPSLDELKNRISSLKNKRRLKREQRDRENATKDMNTGLKVLSEILGIMIASIVIGYFLDQWLETTPALLLVFMVLGIVTIFYNLMKYLQTGSEAIGYQTDEKESENAANVPLITPKEPANNNKTLNE